ncbi:MAG: response regulator [Bacteroidetes bacterium]|nr:response regulator [Bacteroidota bacterium]
MTKIKVLIVDDESRARSLLRNLLTEYCAETVEISAECDDLPSCVKAIHKHKPDLVFLDIEMPGHTGLELLDFFDDDSINFSIIFTTAYDHYAVRAFKLSAIDYIMKPIEPNELKESVERFIKKKEVDEKGISLLRQKVENMKDGKLAVPTSSGLKFLNPETIVYLKADSNYTEIRLQDDSKILVSMTLKSFDEALEGNPIFSRVNKSYLINTSFVTEYVKADGGYVLMNEKHQVTISAEKLQELLEKNKVMKR